MENLLLLFMNGLFAKSSFTKKGAAAKNKLPVQVPGLCSKNITPCGDELYFGEHCHQQAAYGAIHIKLKRRYPPGQAFQLLKKYIENLKKAHAILHETEGGESASSFITYWQDAKGVDWKGRAVVEARSLSFLYVKNFTSVSTEEHDRFLYSSLSPAGL